MTNIIPKHKILKRIAWYQLAFRVIYFWLFELEPNLNSWVDRSLHDFLHQLVSKWKLKVIRRTTGLQIWPLLKMKKMQATTTETAKKILKPFCKCTFIWYVWNMTTFKCFFSWIWKTIRYSLLCVQSHVVGFSKDGLVTIKSLNSMVDITN